MKIIILERPHMLGSRRGLLYFLHTKNNGEWMICLDAEMESEEIN